MAALTEIQEYTIGYCIRRGFELEKRLEEIHALKNANIIPTFDEMDKLKKEESSIFSEMSKVRKEYDEAIHAREEYEAHLKAIRDHHAAAKLLNKKWGFETK